MPPSPRAPHALASADPADPIDDGPSAAQAAAQARDLRGAARLATEARRALLALAEAIHAPADAAPGAPVQVPGLVYKTLRGASRPVDADVDTLLALLVPVLATPPGPGREPGHHQAIISALNGVLGDHLAYTSSPLATRMAFHHAGRALPLDRDALAEALPDAGEQLLVLLHDTCSDDLQWHRAEPPGGSGASRHHDHGGALAQALGFTPLYLRHDSGLHVSTNGRALAGRLERLLHEWPRPIARFAVLAHGTGGLLARSALHYGREAGHHWPHRLDDLACLGTPHHGAPLERPGLELLMSATPHRDPLVRLAALRSAGLTDLRDGNLLDGDWMTGDRLARASDRRTAVPLPAGPRCYAIAGSAPGPSPASAPSDGLVSVASALGRHRLARRTLKFPPDHQRTFDGIDHAQLLSSDEVFEQLRRWFAH